MLKKSLLATTAIIACTIIATQAQAVTQTIQWDFNVTFGPVASQTLGSTNLLPGMNAADGNIVATGWRIDPLSLQLTLLTTTRVQGDLTGVGVQTPNSDDTTPTFINPVIVNGTASRVEVLALDLLNPLTFINTNGLNTMPNATWEIDLTSVDSGESVRILTGAANNQANAALNDITVNGFSPIIGSLNRYLFIRQSGTTSSTFQVSGLRFSYEEVPEPGMIGLLGFSLAGLVLLRSRE